MATSRSSAKHSWRDKSVYQIVTDRFALADDSTPECELRTYCGGTWKGIENKLSYISDMGFDAIWISPVTHSLEENTTWGYGYHGYWLDDPFRLNNHFGTADDLRNLTDAVHKRNMSVMVDVVINHFAINNNPPTFDHLPSPFNNCVAFHPQCAIDYDNQTSVENCWLVHDQLPFLADVNTENAVVFDTLVESVAQLVKDYHFDGIRLDTARHIARESLAKFQDAVGVFVTGEVLEDNVNYVSQYQGSLDSLLNYPLYFETGKVFGDQGTFHKLADIIQEEQAAFLDPTVLVNFLDNHDQPRYAGRSANLTSAINAATLIILMPGIPSIYYGFEQQLEGAQDPENRRPLWTAGYERTTPLYDLLTRLNQTKRLGGDAFNNNTVDILEVGDTHMVFQRGPLLITINNGVEHSISQGREEKHRRVKTSFDPQEELVDLLGCISTATVDLEGFLTISPGLAMPQVWASRDLAGNVCRYERPDMDTVRAHL